MANVKIKLSRNVLMLAAVVAAVVVSVLLYEYIVPKPITSWEYNGLILNFRSDLKEANKIPVYPGETQLYLDTMHPLVKNVTIAFKETEENGYYAAEAFEITYKMTLAYYNLFGSVISNTTRVPGFDVQTVDQYAHLPGKIQNPIIAIVHPDYANETAVRNEGHVTYISGKTYEELDLAVTKFLMVVLDIQLES